MPIIAPQFAEVAQPVADPGRANILSTLMDGPPSRQANSPSSPASRRRRRVRIPATMSAFEGNPEDSSFRPPDEFTPMGAARHSTIDPHSAVIRKQLDRVVEAADRIFADTFEVELAFDEVGERAG
jgi:hypothetical protein